MNISGQIPNDIEELKKLLILSIDKVHTLATEAEQFKSKIQVLEKEIEIRDKTILSLREMFVNLRRTHFGSKSERFKEDERQGYIFNEIELGLHDEKELFSEHAKEEKTEVSSYNRKKPGRKKLPETLRREDEICEIPESEKQCSCGHELENIGAEESETLVIIPPDVYVRRQIRKKYACNHCKGDERDEAGKIVVIAEPKIPAIYPGSNLSVEMLVFLIVSKFIDSIPFYRISQMLLRIKVQIPRGTLCNWVNGVYLKYKEILDFFPDLVQMGGLIGIDETTHRFIRKKIGAIHQILICGLCVEAHIIKLSFTTNIRQLDQLNF